MSLSIQIVYTPKVELVKISNDLSILGEMCNKVYGTGVDVVKFPVKIIKRRHMSPFEFIDTIWYIECSRVVSHELVRHRIASYWQESQRFVKTKPIFLLPRSLVEKIKLSEFQKLIGLLADLYMFYQDLTKDVKEFGEDFKQFARYVLPQCVLTRIYAKFNLRELIEVIFPLRMCKRAQPEFRYIAIKMYLILKQALGKYADILNFTGPRCIWFGKCPEFGYTNEDIMKKCRVEAYKEAFLEHGTEEELRKLEEIIKQLP